MNVIRLAVRLAVGGGREAVVRLAVTSAGVGLGVCLLLLAAVTFPAIKAHEAREAWTYTTSHNDRPGQDETTTDPLLWRVRGDAYDGHEITRVDLAPLGSRAPVPPGLARLPGPGELMASPAMLRLMRGAPRATLADRYPGSVAGTVGDAALLSPDDLVVFVGYDPAQLRGQPRVSAVRSIEAQPRSVSLTRFGRIALGLGAGMLLVPIVVLIGTAARLAMARREQRLAAMRLVGATPRQVRITAATEAVLGALTGTLLGFAGFALVRPYAARFNVDGSPFFPSDLRLPWLSAVLVVLGVPVVSVLAALVSLRRVQISPLGVSRHATPRPPRWLRLIPLAVGLAGFAVSMPALATAQGDWANWVIAAVVALIVIGIVVAGPWLTLGVGRFLTLLSGRILAGRTPALLAGRRLVDNPSAGFRSISGLVLAVFLITVASAATQTAATLVADPGQVLLPASAVGQEFVTTDGRPVPAERANALATRLRAIPGVTGVLDLRWPGPWPPAGGGNAVPVVTRCADLRATGLGNCPDPAATVGLDARLLANGFVQDVGRPAADTPVDRLPAAGVVVVGNGSRTVLETARTAIEQAADDTPWLPWTTDELKGQSHRQTDRLLRLSNAVLVITLLIAGFSLAVSVAGGLVERQRPFALLRLAGVRPADLRRVVLAETAGPLIAIAVASAALGFAVEADMTWVAHVPWRLPNASYWWTLGGGLVLSVGVAALATLPLLSRLTAPQTARFE